MHDFRGPALITLGVVILMFVMAANVGRARGKYKIDAPATTGHPDFERVFRVQMNTLENALMFLPALWIFAAFASELWASAIGVLWLLARCWYAMSYQKAANLRGPGFIVGTMSIAVLTLGGAGGVIKAYL